MASVSEIDRYTGAAGSPTRTDVTSALTKLSTADTATPSAAHAIPRPAASPPGQITRSYWMTLALYVTVAPAGGINNIKFWMDGTSAFTGCTLYVGETNTYTQATGTEGSYGDDSLVATTDAFTYTQASPLAVTSNATTGTGRFSYYLVFQVDVTSSANPGDQSAESYWIGFDEN